MPARCYITHRADFIRLLRRGRRLRGEGWLLHHAPSRSCVARFAVNLNKRHVRLAVHRNLLRRRLRERFRQEWQRTLPAMDCLIRSTMPPPKNADPCAAVRRLLDSMGNR